MDKIFLTINLVISRWFAVPQTKHNWQFSLVQLGGVWTELSIKSEPINSTSSISCSSPAWKSFIDENSDATSSSSLSAFVCACSGGFASAAAAAAAAASVAAAAAAAKNTTSNPRKQLHMVVTKASEVC